MAGVSQMKIVNGVAGYVLEDVPHLTDYIPHLPVMSSISFHFSYVYIIDA
jgi:6-phosphofructokinase 1